MKYTILLLATGLSLFPACKAPQKEATTFKEDAIPVRVIKVAAPSQEGIIETSGQFTTDDEVYLSFKTGGIIRAVAVKEGDAIRKGQILATLNLTEINATVAQYQLGFEKSKRDLNRTKNLFADSVATLEQLQNVQTAHDLARQQLDAALFNQSKSTIVATTDGFVLKKLASEGQLVAPGTPVLLINGAGKTKWQLKAGLSDAQWQMTHIGDSAQVTVNGNIYPALVIRKSEAADPITGVLSVDLQLTGTTPKGIAAGLFGQAIIKCAALDAPHDLQPGAVAIPYAALLDADGRTGFVFTTTDNRTAHKTRVVIDRLEKETAIISEGLENTGSVIVTGSAYLTDHSSIKIIQ